MAKKVFEPCVDTGKNLVTRVYLEKKSGGYAPLDVATLMAALRNVEPKTKIKMLSDEEGNQENGVLFIDVAKDYVCLTPHEGAYANG